MGNLIGRLSKIDIIQGTLVPIQNTIIHGNLSSINNQLIGILASTHINNLVGTLKDKNKSLNGILSIPPESFTEFYDGEYAIIPKPFREQDLKTAGLKMKQDVIVSEIPFYKTSNENGYTVYIGGE